MEVDVDRTCSMHVIRKAIRIYLNNQREEDIKCKLRLM
jgi:hypothetical protein